MDKTSSLMIGLVFLAWSMCDYYFGCAFSITKLISHLVCQKDSEMEFMLYVVFKGIGGLACVLYFFLEKIGNQRNGTVISFESMVSHPINVKSAVVPFV